MHRFFEFGSWHFQSIQWNSSNHVVNERQLRMLVKQFDWLSVFEKVTITHVSVQSLTCDSLIYLLQCMCMYETSDPKNYSTNLKRRKCNGNQKDKRESFHELYPIKLFSMFEDGQEINEGKALTSSTPFLSSTPRPTPALTTFLEFGGEFGLILVAIFILLGIGIAAAVSALFWLVYKIIYLVTNKL